MFQRLQNKYKQLYIHYYGIHARWHRWLRSWGLLIWVILSLADLLNFNKTTYLAEQRRGN